jgi:hypothetical protein
LHNSGPQDIERVTQYYEPPDAPGLAFNRPRATLFSHHGYLAHDIYPEGVADVVGYWAEDRILGGVAVFDRPAERTLQQPPNAYFHGCRDNVTYRYFQLRDYQQQAMLDFFQAEDPGNVPCPLPVIGDRDNWVRVDFWEAITHRFIHRDAWECKPPSEATVRFWQRRPQGEFDYPRHRTLLNAVNTTLGIPAPQHKEKGGSAQPRNI